MIIYKIIKKIQNCYRDYEIKCQNFILIKAIKSLGGVIEGAVSFGHNVMLSGGGNIQLGSNVHIGSNSFIRAEGGLKIGSNVVISRNLVLYTNSHNYEGSRLPFDETYKQAPVIIEDNVWIGMNVTISPGTIIREGAIIGLGSRVFKEVPRGAVVGSGQLKFIKNRNEGHYTRLKKNQSFGDGDGLEYNSKGQG